MTHCIYKVPVMSLLKRDQANPQQWYANLKQYDKKANAVEYDL